MLESWEYLGIGAFVLFDYFVTIWYIFLVGSQSCVDFQLFLQLVVSVNHNWLLEIIVQKTIAIICSGVNERMLDDLIDIISIGYNWTFNQLWIFC
jgi:hypothetical protein